jgi:hypothetical protein
MRVCYVNPQNLQLHHKPEVMTFPGVSTERAELENFAHAIEQKHALAVPGGDEEHGAAVLEAVLKSAQAGKSVRVGWQGQAKSETHPPMNADTRRQELRDWRLVIGAALALVATNAAAQPSPLDFLIARAKALELDTPYVPPPGTAMEHHASGYAKVMCSAVFITGLDPEFARRRTSALHRPGTPSGRRWQAGNRPCR